MLLGIVGGPSPQPTPESQPNAGAQSVAPAEETSASNGAGDASTNSSGNGQNQDQSRSSAQGRASTPPAIQATQTEARLAEQALTASAGEPATSSATSAATQTPPNPVPASAQAKPADTEQTAATMDAIGQAAEGVEVADIGPGKDNAAEDAASSGFSEAAKAEEQAGAAPNVSEARYSEVSGLMAQSSGGSGVDQRV